MNVALTRGRRAVWVLGHSASLSVNPHWESFIQHAQAQACCFPMRKPFRDHLFAAAKPASLGQTRPGGSGGPAKSVADARRPAQPLARRDKSELSEPGEAVGQAAKRAASSKGLPKETEKGNKEGSRRRPLSACARPQSASESTVTAGPAQPYDGLSSSNQINPASLAHGSSKGGDRSTQENGGVSNSISRQSRQVEAKSLSARTSTSAPRPAPQVGLGARSVMEVHGGSTGAIPTESSLKPRGTTSGDSANKRRDENGQRSAGRGAKRPRDAAPDSQSCGRNPKRAPGREMDYFDERRARLHAHRDNRAEVAAQVEQRGPKGICEPRAGEAAANSKRPRASGSSHPRSVSDINVEMGNLCEARGPARALQQGESMTEVDVPNVPVGGEF